MTRSTGYRSGEGLGVYESAMAAPYFEYARLVVQTLFRKHAIRPGASLDLACGGGRLVDYLCGEGWEAYGCDLSEDAIAAARRAFPALRDRFFVADMAVVPGKRTFDLVTVVFNSIHYLPPPGREKLWARLATLIRPGGHFISQHNTFEAMESYWLGSTHRWTSEDGVAFWTGLPHPGERTIDIDKMYFARAGEDRYRLARVQHPYHFFTLDEMSEALQTHGLKIDAVLDGKGLGKPGPRTTSIWVVATRGE